MSIPLLFPMENTSNYIIHNAVKAAWKQFDAQIKEKYQGYWCELLFESDDVEGYASDFLAELNGEARKGSFDAEKLRSLIAIWHEDMMDHRSIEEAKAEGGDNVPADEFFKELGI